MSFKGQGFVIYFVSSADVLSKACKVEIEKYFTNATLIELTKDNAAEIEVNSTEKSILILDASLPEQTASSLIKRHTNKSPIIWLSASNDDAKALELLDSGKINNVCSVSDQTSVIYSILRELRGELVRSQIQVLTEQSTIISEVSLNTQTAVLTTNAQGFIIWANEANAKLTGYSLAEMLGKKPGEILQGPDTNPETIAYISSKLKQQVPFSVEILNYHKNGEKVWLKLNITPIFQDNKIERFIAFQEDITEKKVNEQKLAHSLERLQDAQRIGKMCDWVMDAKSYDISWSGRALEILELKETTEFDYWKFRRQLSLSGKQQLQSALFELRKSNREYDLVLEYNAPTGNRKMLRTMGVPVFKNNELEKIVGIVQDITEQYEAEILASKSLQHLNTIAENMKGGVCRVIDKVDGAVEVVFVNQGFYDMFELTEEEVHKDFNNVLQLVHPDDPILNIHDILLEVQKTGEAVDQYFRVITKSGSLKWMHLISNATSGLNGDIVHDFIVTNITERIQKDRLLEEISEVSQNGGWELDLLTGTLNWTDVTKQIHEVPKDFTPDPSTAINFYKEGASRDLISQHFEQLISKGISHDGRFEIITAKGNHKWVRAKGAAEYAGDKIVRVFGFFQDITETVQREEAILHSLHEKDALLGEIHHRVKNNLAVISGLLQLELMKGDDAKLSLEDAVNRIQSIAAVHEILYNTENFNVIYLDAYLDKLTVNIAKTNPSFITDIKLEANISQVGISINKAVPVGLLLNELITNSLKHAFKNTNAGTISISIHKPNPSTLQMVYSDSGPGFDEDLLDNGNSLGYKLINSLMLQLEATHHIKTKNGFKLDCTFSTETDFS